MADPTTWGALAAAALSAAGEAFLKGSLGEAAKDAYKQLKSFLGGHAESDVAALEQSPASPARKAVLAEVVDALPPADLDRVRLLSEALVQAMEDDPRIHEASLIFNQVTTRNLILDQAHVAPEGKIVVSNTKVEEDLTARGITVGLSEGKAAR